MEIWILFWITPGIFFSIFFTFVCVYGMCVYFALHLAWAAKSRATNCLQLQPMYTLVLSQFALTLDTFSMTVARCSPKSYTQSALILSHEMCYVIFNKNDFKQWFDVFVFIRTINVKLQKEWIILDILLRCGIWSLFHEYEIDFNKIMKSVRIVWDKFGILLSQYLSYS